MNPREIIYVNHLSSLWRLVSPQSWVAVTNIVVVALLSCV